MAGIGGIANTPEISITAAVKTLLQLVAPTNHRGILKEWSVSFKGIVSVDTPVLVELLRQTTAGTMTALTLVKVDPTNDETLQFTAQHTSTSEPTAGDVIALRLVHPQGGLYEWTERGMALPIPGGTRLALRATPGATVTGVAGMVYEE